MVRPWATWLVLFAAAGVLFLVNWHCWRPGVGGAVGGRPPGTQLERSFGWPATYQAELWRSDDVELASRILARAPFYYLDGEMSLEDRQRGTLALVVDVGFALSVLLGVGVIAECALRGAWSRRGVILLICAAMLSLLLWSASSSVSVSL